MRPTRGPTNGRLDLRRQLATGATEISNVVEAIASCLADPYELYRQLPNPERRLMTLTIFGSLRIDTKQIVSHELRPPFAELLDVQHRHHTTKTTRSYHRRGRATHQDPQPKEDTLSTEDVPIGFTYHYRLTRTGPITGSGLV